jgi:hypothetical protein
MHATYQHAFADAAAAKCTQSSVEKLAMKSGTAQGLWQQDKALPAIS